MATMLHRSERISRKAIASPLIETLMRLGYGVRGLVCIVIGILALRVALGSGGSLADPQGAIVALGETGGGSIVLYAVLIGLIGYALWGVVRAVFDPLHKGTDAKGIAARVGYLISAVSYALLALASFGLITGRTNAAHNGAQGAQTQQTTASLLSQPWGPLAVGAAGLITMALGVVQIVQGLRGTFDQQFEPYALSSDQRRLINRIGRFGTAARGVVFAMIGLFLVLAAWYHDPQQAQGMNGALAALLQQPYGPWLLGIVALGLIAFGGYSVMSGVWLRLRRP